MSGLQAWHADGAWYRLRGRRDAGTAWLEDRQGLRWAELRALADVDTVDGRDETLAVDGPAIADRAGDGRSGASARLTWRLRSSRWDGKRVVVEATSDAIAVHAEVDGRGAITDVSLLGGRLVTPRITGRVLSGAWFESLVSGGPADPRRVVRSAQESQDIGVSSGSEPGRGAWFFTPGPFVYAASRATAPDSGALPAGPWLSFGLRVGRREAGFTTFGYEARERGFAFDLAYDGKTRVDGTWRSPTLLLRVAVDPYAAIADWRRDLEAAGTVQPATSRDTPAWWRQPMFCGWGAQSALAREDGLPMSATPRYATQAGYDHFLAELEERGIHPGTIVIDDKWQRTYGANEPDTTKWPDLRGWIARRHAAGRRVLLWCKAWDPEDLLADWCVRNASGEPIALDPSHPEGEAAVRGAVRRMLSPDGLDADGLKIDFTAKTPSGVATTHHGPAWGVDLLGRLVEVIANEAGAVKRDALLVGHAPNPLVAPALGMLRLNDALRLDDPHPDADVVAQMRHRAAIVRAACPDHPIDTDDWCMPDRTAWRAYAEAKIELGVPALYTTTRLDRTGEQLGSDDAALVRRTWATYREREGLDEPGPDVPAAG